jgi:hypothetical protein
MTTAFDPDWGVVTSSLYQDVVPSREPGAPLVGWLTYLRVPSKNLPTFPSGVRVVPLSDWGSVIVATEERFTAADPRHVQVADAVSGALSVSGFLSRTA